MSSKIADETNQGALEIKEVKDVKDAKGSESPPIDPACLLKDAKTGQLVPLKFIDVKLAIDEGPGWTERTYYYVNTSDKIIQPVQGVATNRDSPVTGLEAVLKRPNGTKECIKCYVGETAKVAADFKAAVSQGFTAVKADQQSHKLAVITLGNLEPGASCAIRVTNANLNPQIDHDQTDGSMTLRSIQPLMLGDSFCDPGLDRSDAARFGPRRLHEPMKPIDVQVIPTLQSGSIKVRIHATMKSKNGIIGVRCLTHDMVVRGTVPDAKNPQHEVTLELKSGIKGEALRSSLVIHWSLVPFLFTATRQYCPSFGATLAWWMMVPRPMTTSKLADLECAFTLVLDVSGSMTTDFGGESRLVAMKTSAIDLLAVYLLNAPKSTLNVMTFESHQTWMWRTHRPCTMTSIAEAVAWIRSRTTGDSTYMSEAVSAALDQPEDDKKRPRRTIMITDAEIIHDGVVKAVCDEKASEQNSLWIMEIARVSTLHHVARAGHGISHCVGTGSSAELEATAKRMMVDLIQPAFAGATYNMPKECRVEHLDEKKDQKATDSLISTIFSGGTTGTDDVVASSTAASTASTTASSTASSTAPSNSSSTAASATSVSTSIGSVASGSAKDGSKEEVSDVKAKSDDLKVAEVKVAEVKVTDAKVAAAKVADAKVADAKKEEDWDLLEDLFEPATIATLGNVKVDVNIQARVDSEKVSLFIKDHDASTTVNAMVATDMKIPTSAIQTMIPGRKFHAGTPMTGFSIFKDHRKWPKDATGQYVVLTPDTKSQSGYAKVQGDHVWKAEEGMRDGEELATLAIAGHLSLFEAVDETHSDCIKLRLRGGIMGHGVSFFGKSSAQIDDFKNKQSATTVVVPMPKEGQRTEKDEDEDEVEDMPELLDKTFSRERRNTGTFSFEHTGDGTFSFENKDTARLSAHATLSAQDQDDLLRRPDVLKSNGSVASTTPSRLSQFAPYDPYLGLHLPSKKESLQQTDDVMLRPIFRRPVYLGLTTHTSSAAERHEPGHYGASTTFTAPSDAAASEPINYQSTTKSGLTPYEPLPVDRSVAEENRRLMQKGGESWGSSTDSKRDVVWDKALQADRDEALSVLRGDSSISSTEDKKTEQIPLVALASSATEAKEAMDAKESKDVRLGAQEQAKQQVATFLDSMQSLHQHNSQTLDAKVAAAKDAKETKEGRRGYRVGRNIPMPIDSSFAFSHGDKPELLPDNTDTSLSFRTGSFDALMFVAETVLGETNPKTRFTGKFSVETVLANGTYLFAVLVRLFATKTAGEYIVVFTRGDLVSEFMPILDQDIPLIQPTKARSTADEKKARDEEGAEYDRKKKAFGVNGRHEETRTAFADTIEDVIFECASHMKQTSAETKEYQARHLASKTKRDEKRAKEKAARMKSNENVLSSDLGRLNKAFLEAAYSIEEVKKLNSLETLREMVERVLCGTTSNLVGDVQYNCADNNEWFLPPLTSLLTCAPDTRPVPLDIEAAHIALVCLDHLTAQTHETPTIHEKFFTLVSGKPLQAMLQILNLNFSSDVCEPMKRAAIIVERLLKFNPGLKKSTEVQAILRSQTLGPFVDIRKKLAPFLVY